MEFFGRCGGLPENEAAKVMHELSIGKDFVLAELRMRTDCFSQLPLHLLCLGHHDLGVMRAHLAICLIQYEHLRCTGADAHPMTRALLSPGGPLRDSVMVFLHGGDLSPALLDFRRKAQLSSNLEVAVERRHAQLHQHLRAAPHHSEAFASIGLRRHEILEDMRNNPAVANRMAVLIDRAGHPKCALEQLGLRHHPVLAPYFVGGLLPRRTPHAVAGPIIYRCDLRTQFGPLPSVAKGPDPESNKETKFEKYLTVEEGVASKGDKSAAGGDDAHAPSSSSAGVPSQAAANQEGRQGASSSLAQPGSRVDEGGSAAGIHVVAEGTASAVALEAERNVGGPGPVERDVLEKLMREALVSHLLMVAKPDMVVSMQKSFPLPSLSEALAPCVQCPPDLLDELAECDVDWAVVGRHVALPKMHMQVDMEEIDVALDGPERRAGEVPQGAAVGVGPAMAWETNGLTFFRFVSKSLALVHSKIGGDRHNLKRSDVTLALLRIHAVNRASRVALLSDAPEGERVAHMISHDNLLSVIDIVCTWSLEPAPPVCDPEVGHSRR